jgi:hypothetical protein
MGQIFTIKVCSAKNSSNIWRRTANKQNAFKINFFSLKLEFRTKAKHFLFSLPSVRFVLKVFNYALLFLIQCCTFLNRKKTSQIFTNIDKYSVEEHKGGL